MRQVIRICVAIILYAISVSCAIHDSFPFICFRSGCVENQFGFKKISKRISVQISAGQRKRRSRRAIAAAKIRKPGVELPGDSVLAMVGERVVYTKFLLVFYLQTGAISSDTLIVNYSSEYKSIMNADEIKIAALVNDRKPWEITRITIREMITSPEKEDQHVISARGRSIKKLLHGTGVSYSKMVMETER
jgi:hypothetical protein